MMSMIIATVMGRVGCSDRRNSGSGGKVCGSKLLQPRGGAYTDGQAAVPGNETPEP
jgi:hypothetical protein